MNDDEKGRALKRIEDHPLIQFKQRWGSARGWTIAGLIQHLKDHQILRGGLRTQWCSTNCMARTMFGRDAEINRKKVRKGIGTAFPKLLTLRHFLLKSYSTEPSAHGCITACKLYDSRNEDDAQLAEYQLERMDRLKEITADKLIVARGLLLRSAPRR